jgi:hypothetical protein
MTGQNTDPEQSVLGRTREYVAALERVHDAAKKVIGFERYETLPAASRLIRGFAVNDLRSAIEEAEMLR